MNIEISVNDTAFTLTRDTAQVFRFRRMPQADHCYYEDESSHFYIFDRQDLLEIMEAQNARTITDDLPSDNDMEAYVNWTMGLLRPLEDDLGEL